MSPTTQPDAVERVALEEERDFLLRSLDDLERERDAGDIDEEDYVQLRDDYTVRAAAVLRSLDRATGSATNPGRPAPLAQNWRRRTLWLAGLLLFGVLAGVLVARTAGRRQAGDVATGEPATGAAVHIARAQQAMGESRFDDAIAEFTKALDVQPSNVQALTYRGWLYALQAELPAAKADLAAAVAADPKFTDSRVFSAVVALRENDLDAAASHYDAIDFATAPGEILTLLDQFGVRQRIVVPRVTAKLLVASPPSLAASGLSADDVIFSAEVLSDEQSNPLDAIKVLDVVLKAQPDNVDALAASGWTKARVGREAVDANLPGGQQLLNSGKAELDRAFVLSPKQPYVLVYRAFVLFQFKQYAEADAALRAFDAGLDRPQTLVELLGASQLGQAITDALKPK